MVTSSIFLPSYIAYLTPPSQELLLRGYFFVSLIWWIARGRPSLNITEFFSSPTHRPTSSNKPHPSAIVPLVTPNPWLPLLANSVIHPSDHHAKLQRALSHYGMLYGGRDAARGKEDFGGTELEGAEMLDGSLFVRAAMLTDKRLGRVLEGEESQEWDFTGFYQQGSD